MRHFNSRSTSCFQAWTIEASVCSHSNSAQVRGSSCSIMPPELSQFSPPSVFVLHHLSYKQMHEINNKDGQMGGIDERLDDYGRKWLRRYSVYRFPVRYPASTLDSSRLCVRSVLEQDTAPSNHSPLVGWWLLYLFRQDDANEWTPHKMQRKYNPHENIKTKQADSGIHYIRKESLTTCIQEQSTKV